MKKAGLLERRIKTANWKLYKVLCEERMEKSMPDVIEKGNDKLQKILTITATEGIGSQNAKKERK